jgi:hypothetical protein
LLILLTNAIKFTPKEGSIKLGVNGCESRSETESTVAFTVVDCGIGIAPDQQERIFEPLTQGDNSLSRTHQGMGMGLALARRTVEAMGGTIHVASAPHQGATFSFKLTFPIASSTEAPSPDLRSPAGAGGWFSRFLGRARVT